MKTNLFNTNYSAPEMKVIEIDLQSEFCAILPGSTGVTNNADGSANVTDFTVQAEW